MSADSFAWLSHAAMMCALQHGMSMGGEFARPDAVKRPKRMASAGVRRAVAAEQDEPAEPRGGAWGASAQAGAGFDSTSMSLVILSTTSARVLDWPNADFTELGFAKFSELPVSSRPDVSAVAAAAGPLPVLPPAAPAALAADAAAAAAAGARPPSLPRPAKPTITPEQVMAHGSGPLIKRIPKRLRPSFKRICKYVGGCTKELAVTSTSYCEQHVGSVTICTMPDCMRAAEGPGPLCRLHAMAAAPPVPLLAADGKPLPPKPARTLPKPCNFDECPKTSRGSTSFCIQHGGGKRCQFVNCSRSARGATSFCVTHGGGRRCEVAACPKSAVGSTNLCIAHGGGRRCKFPECERSAEGATSFCIRHGGGRRCKTAGCNKSAVGSTDYCVACGGGRRCVVEGCDKSAVGSTQFCKGHGGGRRCTHPDGCSKSAQGATFLCIMHGGGRKATVAATNAARNGVVDGGASS